MSLITVNNTQLNNITSFSCSWNDLDSENTGRSEGTGVLTRERIRANVHQIDINFDMITDNELAMLQALFSPESVSVSFWIGKDVTATMYAAGGSCDWISQPDGTCYWNFKITLTEF